MKTLKVALIGCGRAGMVHGRNFRFRVPGVELVAVVDPNEGSCKAACEELDMDKYYLTYEELFKKEKLDVVVIASPTRFHCDITLKAFEHGIHVLTEKPMAASEDECRTMAEAAKKAGLKLQVGYMRRHERSYSAAKEAIKNGEIGDIVAIHSHTRGPSKPHDWMFDVKHNNGTLSEEASHDIDCARWMSESEFDYLFCVAGNYRNKEVAEQWPDFYDNVIMTGKFKNGIEFSIEGSQYVQYGHDERIEILGTKGNLIVSRDSKYDYQIYNSKKEITTPYADTWIDLFREAYLEEDTDFIRCIRENLTPRVTGNDGLMAVKVVNAGNESIRTGKIVYLD